MRKHLIALLTLTLIGCGGSSDPVSTAPITNPSPGSPPVVLTAANALSVARTLDELFVPSGRNSVELAGGNLSAIEIDGVAAALIELPLAYPFLVQGTSGRFNGPGGGTAELVVNGTNLEIVFANFVTGDGTRLNGVVFMSAVGQEIVVTFDGYQTTDSDGFHQIDGPVTLMHTRPDATVEQVVRRQNVTVTDLARGGLVRILDGDSEAEIFFSEGFQSGVGTNFATLVFEGFEGLTGELEVVPDIPYAFTVDLTTLTSTVTAGQSFLEGSGTIRRRVIAPNMIEVAVQPEGAADFQVVGVSDITDVDAE